MYLAHTGGAGGTKTKELAFEGGSLIVKDKDDKLVAPTVSELQFLSAMTRRGIAFKFARLMTYEQHSTCCYRHFKEKPLQLQQGLLTSTDVMR